MPKPKFIDTSVPEHDVELGPSRTKKREERRRTQDALDELTRLLAEAPPRVLAGLGLDDGVVEAVLAYKRLPRGGAAARQRRLVARLLRSEDPELLQRVARALASGG